MTGCPRHGLCCDVKLCGNGGRARCGLQPSSSSPGGSGGYAGDEDTGGAVHIGGHVQPQGLDQLCLYKAKQHIQQLAVGHRLLT